MKTGREWLLVERVPSCRTADSETAWSVFRINPVSQSESIDRSIDRSIDQSINQSVLALLIL